MHLVEGVQTDGRTLTWRAATDASLCAADTLVFDRFARRRRRSFRQPPVHSVRHRAVQ